MVRAESVLLDNRLRGYKRRLIVTGVTCLLLVSSLIGIGAGFCAATLHVTRRTGPKPIGAEPVQIVADDRANLKAWWFNSKTPNGGCVIVLHGIADSRASSSGFAPMFLRPGYSVLAPDSRAHGESGGKFVTYGLLEKYDVVLWAHWMQRHGCQRIYGLGESLGASVLIQAIAVGPVFNAIVAESPYADLQHMAKYRLKQSVRLPAPLSGIVASGVVKAGMLYARLFDKLDFSQVAPMESLRASATPVLLIHGTGDTRTPPEESQRLASVRQNSIDLWLVPHGGHTDASSVAPSEFQARVLHWFSKH